jgi:hypothetical protein
MMGATELAGKSECCDPARGNVLVCSCSRNAGARLACAALRVWAARLSESIKNTIADVFFDPSEKPATGLDEGMTDC